MKQHPIKINAVLFEYDEIQFNVENGGVELVYMKQGERLASRKWTDIRFPVESITITVKDVGKLKVSSI